MPDMIYPHKGIDLMNNNSIINRILFAITIFQHSQHHSILMKLSNPSLKIWYKKINMPKQ
jgi:hypothetical protein